MFNPKLFLLTPMSTVFIVCLSVIGVLILIVFVCLLWWKEIKQKPLKEFGEAIKRFFGAIFKKISPNKAVKTVYSNKSKNYSGTEFLPVPSKAPTKEFTYEFVGWNKNFEDEVGHTVAKPIFIKKVNTCRVNVFDDDEITLLKTDVVEYGAGIDLTGIKPSKSASKEFSYEFVGWDKDITKFYKSENVYAVYKAIPKKFTYTFLDSDEVAVLAKTTAIYGTPILAPKKNPTCKNKDYEFAFWKGFQEGMVLTKDIEFIAVYRKINSSNEDIILSDEVMKKQSISSFEFDREEQTKSSVRLKKKGTLSGKENSIKFFRINGNAGSDENDKIEKKK